MPHGGTTKDENHSPPREGRRGGLSRTIGPTPKATPSAPPWRGFSEELQKQKKKAWNPTPEKETLNFLSLKEAYPHRARYQLV